MTFKKDDINTIDEAKGYSNYHGGVLKPEEKAIFDSSLLKSNGPLDKTLLQDTAQLLNNCKKAEASLKTEQSNDILSNNGNQLLIALMEQRRNNSISYQLINTIKNGED